MIAPPKGQHRQDNQLSQCTSDGAVSIPLEGPRSRDGVDRWGSKPVDMHTVDDDQIILVLTGMKSASGRYAFSTVV